MGAAILPLSTGAVDTQAGGAEAVATEAVGGKLPRLPACIERRLNQASKGIDAYAIVRDVDVLVGPRVRVELSGGVVKGDLRNDVPPVRADDCDHIVRIHGHALPGDVTVRLSPSQEAGS